MLLWSRVKQKQDILLVKPDPKKLISAVASHPDLELSDFTKLANLARFTWLIESADWLSTHDTNKCLYCDKYAEVREVPNVMNSLRSSLIGKKFRFEEDMIAQRILTLSKVVHKKDEFTNVDIVLPQKLLPGVLQGLQKYWKHFDSEPTSMSHKQYISNYGNYTSVSKSTSSEKSGLFAGLLLSTRNESSSLRTLEESLSVEERLISDKIKDLLSLESALRSQGTKLNLKGVSCLAVQGVCQSI